MMHFAAFHLGPHCLPIDQTSFTGIILPFLGVQKMMSAFNVCCGIPNAIKTTFIMEVKSMNPDQTAV